MHSAMKAKWFLVILLGLARPSFPVEAQTSASERKPDISDKVITTDAPNDKSEKIMSGEIRVFFESYLAGWDMANPAKLADHYTIPTAIYGTNGPEVFTSRDLLTEKLKLYCAHFSSIGYAGADFSCKHYTAIGETSAFVDLVWTIHRKEAAPYIFGTAYVLHKSSSEWRIFSAIPYELPRN
jgi:hypothetical protein